MRVYSEAELVKMGNGKKELPCGISRTKHSFRIQKRVANKKYNFGSFQNINLALKTNHYIDILINDYREELKRKVELSDIIEGLLNEQSMNDNIEIARQFDMLNLLILQQKEEIKELKITNNTLINSINTHKSKTIIGKLFGK